MFNVIFCIYLYVKTQYCICWLEVVLTSNHTCSEGSSPSGISLQTYYTYRYMSLSTVLVKMEQDWDAVMCECWVINAESSMLSQNSLKNFLFIISSVHYLKMRYYIQNLVLLTIIFVHIFNLSKNSVWWCFKLWKY